MLRRFRCPSSARARRGSVLLRGRRETSGVRVSRPPALPEGPALGGGGSSGDHPHSPRRTQLVVKGTLGVVGLKTGSFVRCHSIRTFGPTSFWGIVLACSPGIGPVPSAHSHGGAGRRKRAGVRFEPPGRQAGCASGYPRRTDRREGLPTLPPFRVPRAGGSSMSTRSRPCGAGSAETRRPAPCPPPPPGNLRGASRRTLKQRSARRRRYARAHEIARDCHD
jgi:hypothetical protein